MEHNREVTASNSQAALILEISDLRRELRAVITAGKKALPSLPETPRGEFLAALIVAEKYLST